MRESIRTADVMLLTSSRSPSPCTVMARGKMPGITTTAGARETKSLSVRVISIFCVDRRCERGLLADLAGALRVLDGLREQGRHTRPADRGGVVVAHRSQSRTPRVGAGAAVDSCGCLSRCWESSRGWSRSMQVSRMRTSSRCRRSSGSRRTQLSDAASRACSPFLSRFRISPCRHGASSEGRCSR